VAPSPAASPQAPAPVPNAAPTEADKLAAVSKGVAQGAKSLGTVGGAPTPKLDLKTLNSLSDDEFASMVSDKDFKTIMRAHYAA
jgi:hypothetical protein